MGKRVAEHETFSISISSGINLRPGNVHLFVGHPRQRSRVGFPGRDGHRWVSGRGRRTRFDARNTLEESTIDKYNAGNRLTTYGG